MSRNKFNFKRANTSILVQIEKIEVIKTIHILPKLIIVNNCYGHVSLRCYLLLTVESIFSTFLHFKLNFSIFS